MEVNKAVVPESNSTELIAVAASEIKLHGCPHCGFRSFYAHISGGGAASCTCGECGKGFFILADGVEQSTIGVGSKDSETIYPKLQPHPRRGTPSHGTPDTQPEGGGEFFRSRGIGLDNTPGCFICGRGPGLHHNIAAFVQCKQSGERIVGMFQSGARLDYREHSPDRVQVKIGACDQHKQNLELLDTLTSRAKGVLKAAMISEASK